MGAGWFGGLGAGWQGAGWQGAVGSAGGSDGTYAMRPDRPLVAEDLRPDFNSKPKFPIHAWDSDLFSLTFLPEFFTAKVAGKSWEQAITINPIIPKVVMPGGVVASGDDSIDDLRILAVTERPEAIGEILNQAQESAAVLHAAPDDDPEFASLDILSDENSRARRRSGDDASEASI